MHRKFVFALFAAALTALPMSAFVQQASAADAQRIRVRGTVVSLEDKALNVKTREGDAAKITLADGWGVSGVVKASLADIKPGDFVGIASLPRSAGGDGALEVLIFPAAMKGTNEGSYGWDLKPNSTMTNGTVANAVKGVEGHEITVSYKGGEKKITVTDGTPVVTFGPATPADLKPGAVVFIPGEKSAEGVISTKRVVVGTNGVVPPM